MKKLLLVLILFSLGVIIMNAQALNYSARKELLTKQLNNLYSNNDSIFIMKEAFVNGKLFSPPSNNIVHPFFINNDWRSGKVWSSGRIFDVGTIKYDINLDYLMQMHNWVSSAYPIYMTREYIKEFIIDGHHFKYLDDIDETLKDRFKAGYYEALYDEDIKFYLRWEKSKDIHNNSSGSNYEQHIYFLLKKDGKYIHIKGRGGLFDALEDHKKEIKSFMKTNSLRFTKNNYESIVKILNFYDNL